MKKISTKYFVFCVFFISCSSFCAEYSKVVEENVKEQNDDIHSRMLAFLASPAGEKIKINLSSKQGEIGPLMISVCHEKHRVVYRSSESEKDKYRCNFACLKRLKSRILWYLYTEFPVWRWFTYNKR